MNILEQDTFEKLESVETQLREMIQFKELNWADVTIALLTLQEALAVIKNAANLPLSGAQ